MGKVLHQIKKRLGGTTSWFGMGMIEEDRLISVNLVPNIELIQNAQDCFARQNTF